MFPLSASSPSYPTPSVPQTGTPNVAALALSEVEKAMLVKGMSSEQIAPFKIQPALTSAVQLNDIGLCKKILSLGYSVNPPNDNIASSALAAAIHFGFNDIAIFLIEKGADLNLHNDVMGTYLHLAIGRENLTLAEVLLKHNPVLLNQEVVFSNPHAYWPLDSYSGGPFKMPATLNVSPLHLALVLPNPLLGEKMAAFLIQQGAQINAATSTGFNYLHLAACRGYLEVCKLLINKGINIDSICSFTNEVGYLHEMTPLAYSVLKQQVCTTQTILDLNAASTTGNVFDNPFYIAANSGNEELMQCFLNKGAKLDDINKLGHATEPELLKIVALKKAEQRIPLLQLFIKLGMNIHYKGNDQSTYLHYAVIWKDKDVKLCEFLIEHGIDVNALNDKQQNVLCLTKEAEIISLLLKHGANARILDENAHTPLYIQQIETPSSSQQLLDLKAADKGLTALLSNMKLLGLRHSLPGKVFEGSNRHLPYEGIAESLETYLKQKVDAPSFVNQLPATLKQSPHLTIEEILEKIDQGEMVSLAAGWFKHGIAVVCSKDYMIIGNRGDHSGEEPGIKIYKIKNHAHLAEAIKKIISFRDNKIDEKEVIQRKAKNYSRFSYEDLQVQIHEEKKDSHIEYINQGIIQELDLERIVYLPLSHQITGNCAWAAAKMALKGLLIWHFLKENPSNDIQGILPFVKKFYSGWLKFDLLTSLSVLQDAEAEPLLKKFIDFEAAYEELLAANFFREEVCKKLISLKPSLENKKSHPETTLVDLAYKRQNTKLLQWLLEKNVKIKITSFFSNLKPEIDELLLSYLINGGIESNIQDTLEVSSLDYFCMQKNKIRSLQLLQAWKEESNTPSHQESLKKIINKTLEDGSTSMHTLLNNTENLESIKDNINLFLECGADLTLKTQKGVTPILAALWKVNSPKDLEVFKSLLEACPEKNRVLNQLTEKGDTLFDHALNSKNYSEPLAQLLLDHGAKLNINPELLDLYMQKGLKIDLKDSKKATLLHDIFLAPVPYKSLALQLLRAWKQESIEADNLELLKQKVNSADDAGFTPIHYLFLCIDNLKGFDDLFSLLMECGADLSLETNNGYTPLSLVLEKIKTLQGIEIFKILLNSCPDKTQVINKPTLNGETLLDKALNLKEYSEPVTQLLLEEGAQLTNEHVYWFTLQNINPVLLQHYTHSSLKFEIQTSEGITPLHFLAGHSDKLMAINLLKSWKQMCEQSNNLELLQQKINTPSKIGLTPLHCLFLDIQNLEETKELLALFMECGADVSASYNNDVTPLHKAITTVKQPSDLKIIEMLLKNPSQAVKALNPLNPIHNPPLYEIDPNAECSYALAKLLIDHGALVYTNDQGIMYPGVLVKYPDLYQYYEDKRKKQ